MIPRSSGILLHISSLYTLHGIGDFGPSAYAFVDFLNRSGIYFWQTLPLNYTDAGKGYSPYSCLSAFAGNPLFISPDLLVQEGLLEAKELQPPPFREHAVEFDKVHPYKTALLEKAFERFKTKDQKAFQLFNKKYRHWLNDFALFAALKKHQKDSWWLDWPVEWRDRHAGALKKMTVQLKDSIEKEKFFQFLFFQQLEALRAYARTKTSASSATCRFTSATTAATYGCIRSTSNWTKTKNLKKYVGCRPIFFPKPDNCGVCRCIDGRH